MTEGNRQSLSEASNNRIALWGTCGERLFLRRRNEFSPRREFLLRQIEHGGILPTIGFLPTVCTAVLIPFIINYVVKHSLDIPMPDSSWMGITAILAVSRGTKYFPLKKVKRKSLRKYGNGGRAVRRRQMNFYAAGLALSLSYPYIGRLISECVEPVIEKILPTQSPVLKFSIAKCEIGNSATPSHIVTYRASFGANANYRLHVRL